MNNFEFDVIYLIVFLIFILILIIILNKLRMRRLRNFVKKKMEERDDFLVRCHDELMRRAKLVDQSLYRVFSVTPEEMISKMNGQGGCLSYLKSSGEIIPLSEPCPINPYAVSVLSVNERENNLYVPTTPWALDAFYRAIVAELVDEEEFYD